ncbi:Multiple PDZ domain protein [Takifugu flavidus]|uniref:Multiple PDZ domain protein n=1 Tax=Takifugu flavidus TaxID=433684 RepID=A0A5C6MU60_9TELE|nr:Multiple PDZ domain protein [Takifugu flavidus]
MLFHLKILAGVCSDSQKLGTALVPERGRSPGSTSGESTTCGSARPGEAFQTPDHCLGEGGGVLAGRLGWTRVRRAAESLLSKFGKDPLDAGRCVMVIRSLVSGGSAEHHGGLLPGDQLVSVNQVQMDQLSLSETVNLLKSVPAGTVRLGIRKPLVDGAEKSREEDAKIPTPGAKVRPSE